MACWKLKKGWRYEFERAGVRYTGSGYPTKAKALAAQEERKKTCAQGEKAPQGMAFSEVAGLYLDWSEKRHAKKTFEYKRMVFRRFISFNGDQDIRGITPAILHRYLNTRATNHNYNVHRKELSSLFTFA